MISSKSVSICNRFHARWANSGKITISKGGSTPLWCPRSRGISSHSGTTLPYTKLETLGYHMVKTRSLYLTWLWIRTGSWRTDGLTDRIPIANTSSQQYLPVQLSRVKKAWMFTATWVTGVPIFSLKGHRSGSGFAQLYADGRTIMSALGQHYFLIFF